MQRPGARTTRRTLVIETSVAPQALPDTREARGLRLYRDHADAIRFEGGVWLVPSQHD